MPPTPDAAALLAWYDRHRRILPWRAAPGETPDPYRVWLSEIMLQQTTAAAVTPYYQRFLARFPDFRALAAAPAEEVMRLWAGLGYYARARNVHACARTVAAGADGTLPREVAALERLPGIGAYTARAVAAIAFGTPAVPVDGNVERVVARLFAIDVPLPGAKRALAARAARFEEQEPVRTRPGDFAQALFDLGATICTPARPACGLCPWFGACAGRIAGSAETLPRREAKPARPIRHGAAFVLRDGADRVLLVRRPPHGLLGGTAGFPATPFRETPWSEAERVLHAPAETKWSYLGEIRHIFTHFELRLAVHTGVAFLTASPPGYWTEAASVHESLSSLMLKAARLAGLGPAPATKRPGRSTGVEPSLT